MLSRNSTRFFLTTSIALSIFIIVGCSGGNSPTTPSTSNPGDLLLTSPDRVSSANNHGCWGWWSVTLNTETQEIDVEPLRSAAFTCNVTMFMQPPISPTQMLSISIDPSGSDLSIGIFDVEVTLNHPFPGFAIYRGFDVRGIFMADLGETVFSYQPCPNVSTCY